jgi:hypothetical protein
MFEGLGLLLSIWYALAGFLKATWWLWAFFILLELFKSTWLFWKNETWKHSREMQSILLEIRMPREIHQNIKAMDQVLTSIRYLRNAPSDLGEKWFDGEVTRYYSLELVSFGGEVHFYVRTYYKQKGLVEAAFLAYYPDLELVEVDDYVDKLPHNIKEMYARGYDIWGSEMVLGKEEAYPIKTYEHFESPEEEKQYDPLSAFVEVMSKLKKQEIVGVQFIISPLHDDWRDEFKDVVEELRIKKAEEEKLRTKADFSEGKILPVLSVSGGEGDKERRVFESFVSRTPGETDVLKAVEANLSKPAFETLVRFFYLSPKELFYDSFPRRAVLGAFNQYAALDLNYFVMNWNISTRLKFWSWPHAFSDLRVEYRKQRMIFNYRHRELPHETFMGKLLSSYIFNSNFASKSIKLSTTSLATIFHPPTTAVLTAPHIVRVESRKAGPPAGLAIYGEEKELDKYL